MEMSAVPGGWELASVLCKFIFYAGTVSLVGGSISAMLYSDGSRAHLQFCLVYMLAGCVLGFHAALFYYLVQIGLINDSGLAGMFDWGLISLLMDTEVGDATMLRFGGFVFAGMANIVFLNRISNLRRPPSFLFLRQVIIFNMLGFLLLGLSQGRMGHVSVLALPARVSVVMHLMGIAFWIGALLPLRKLCGAADLQQVRDGLNRFGNHAMWIVAMLVCAGAYLILQLLETPADLLATPYGRSLLLKLLLVLAILGIAARNRLRLVPAVGSERGAARMIRSIDMEIGVAVLILLLTAYLSTVLGPGEM